MGWREDAVALRRPSAATTVVVSAALAAAWIWLRLVVVDTALFPLTYVLPLMVSVWTRSRRALWSMAGAFALAQTFKQFVVLPEDVLPPAQNWLFYGATLVNIAVGGAVVHLLVLLRERLEGSNDRLREALVQLEAQAEELASQNEELAQQSEELSQQSGNCRSRPRSCRSRPRSCRSRTRSSRSTPKRSRDSPTRCAAGKRSSRRCSIRPAWSAARTRPSRTSRARPSGCSTRPRRWGSTSGATPARSCGPSPATRRSWTASRRPSWILVIQENRAASLDDVSLRPDLVANPAGGSIASALCAPIRAEGVPKGAICVFSRVTRQWTADQFRLADWLAGQCGHVLQIIRMNADLRRKEEALRNSERLYRAIGESIPYGVWVCEPDGRNIYASESFLRLVGLTQQECSDFGWGSVLHPDDLERTLAAWKECVRTGGVWDIEHRFRGVDGRYHPVLARGLAVRDEQGGIVCWAGINLDITRLKQAEAALVEANRTKDEFLATLSHELRTPLNAIVGWSQMLLSGKLDEESARRAMEIIARNGEAQNRLLEDVLDVSRIVSGKLRLDAEPTDVVSVLEAALESMALAARAKGVEIRRDFRAPSAVVLGDGTRLQQVFWNLLSNAVKFTPAGGRVDVVLEAADSCVSVHVRDTGHGIGPEFLPHVFERFAQHDSSPSRRHSGLGLGLAIVRHLAELHGGTVSADSEGVGLGSTFTVRLPVRLVSDEAAERVPAAGRPREGRELPGVRVLVVDDEAGARELFRAVLERAGADVTAVSSAAEAFECLARVPIDLIVSDIGMPGTDGYSLLTEARNRGISIPAIAVTAYGRSEEATRAHAAGFQVYLPKPVLPDHLITAAERLTGQRAARG